MKKIFSTALVLLGLHMLWAQNPKWETSYNIKKATQSIQLDGVLDDTDWALAEEGTGFYQTYPTDSLAAIDETIFKMTYDDKQLYVGIIAYYENPDAPIVRSLRRDFSWSRNDNVSIYIDPFNDFTNGFTFQVTPLNVQREGLVTAGGDVADDWDNKWYSAAQKFDDYYVVEMAIPFKSIRYNDEVNWNIQFLRNNQKTNERTTYIAVPIQYRSSDLVYSGKLVWDEKPPKAGTNISLIPYGITSYSRDIENDGDHEIKGDVGFDAKIGISNSLNLDLTVNPDFSQVEVDRQVTNLNRFEIFFPERRQFFLENQDLFAQNGFPGARPFFSRRIGIASNNNGLTRQIPILGGARLSGKIGEDWRIGVLNMQTAEDDLTSQPAQNYSVAVFQKQVFSRSNFGGIFVNRQAINFDESDTTLSTTKFNRVFGFDYNLFSPDNTWEGNFFIHKSLDPDPKKRTFSNGAFLRYQTRNFSTYFSQTYRGEDYNAEVGFVRRVGVIELRTGLDLNFFPNNKIQRHGLEIDLSWTNTPDFKNLDKSAEIGYGWRMLNQSGFGFGAEKNWVTLLDDFNPTDSDEDVLLAGNQYEWTGGYIYGETDDRKLLSAGGSAYYGGFYTGTRLGVQGSVDYRFQPYVSLSLDANYNRIEFTEATDFYLIGPRVDITFSNKVFLTTFMQYNNQVDNFNLNSRLQWRFKPVSDLFVVYTDNYNTLLGETKNRALVIKLTYWFNA